jgi:AraC-like DNA-binding protein
MHARAKRAFINTLQVHSYSPLMSEASCGTPDIHLKGEETMGKNCGIQKQYIPFQPGYEGLTNYQSYIVQPSDVLYGIVSDFYQFQINTAGGQTYTIPDGCGDIMFDIQPNDAGGIVCGGKFKRADIGFHEYSQVYGIRFCPGTMRNLLQCSAKDLVEARIPLQSIYNRAELCEKVFNAHTFDERVTVSLDYLQKQFGNLEPMPLAVSYCVKRMIATDGNIPIRELSEETGYSDRYIQKLFKEFMGFTPKQLCTFICFQRSVVQHTFHGQEQTLGDVAYDCGYYDQSHMNRVYKSLASMRPSNIPVRATGSEDFKIAK